MRDPSTHPARRRLHRLGAAVAVAAGLVAVYSCSLIVETSSTQCNTTADCTSLNPLATCDTTTTGDAGCYVDGGADGGYCFDCTPPVTNAEYINACTTGCIPFNNKRVTM